MTAIGAFAEATLSRHHSSPLLTRAAVLPITTTPLHPSAPLASSPSSIRVDQLLHHQSNQLVWYIDNVASSLRGLPLLPAAAQQDMKH